MIRGFLIACTLLVGCTSPQEPQGDPCPDVPIPYVCPDSVPA